MKLHNIKRKNINKSKRRLARGNAGKGGTTAGRGTKGQKCRSGHNIPTGFEGGQTKLSRRLPKIGGFKSNKKPNILIKTSQINILYKHEEVVSPQTLFKKGLIKYIPKDTSVKILYNEKLLKKIKIKNCKASKKVMSLIK